MKGLRVGSLLSVLSSSFALLACSSADEAPAPEAVASAAAQPLVESCTGTYLCSYEGETKTRKVFLQRSARGCVAGQGVLESGHTLTNATGAHEKLGTWSGDSIAFDIRTNSDIGIHCKVGAESATKAPGEKRSGSCSGSTSCSDYSAGNCANHEGCRFAQHVVPNYSGSFDLEYECEGYTRCSYDTQSECERQDCTWEQD